MIININFQDWDFPWNKHHDESETLLQWLSIWLVVFLPLWKIWKSIGMIMPKIWENKKCSKPPTRIIINMYRKKSAPWNSLTYEKKNSGATKWIINQNWPTKKSIEIKWPIDLHSTNKFWVIVYWYFSSKRRGCWWPARTWQRSPSPSASPDPARRSPRWSYLYRRKRRQIFGGDNTTRWFSLNVV